MVSDIQFAVVTSDSSCCIHAKVNVKSYMELLTCKCKTSLISTLKNKEMIVIQDGQQKKSRTAVGQAHGPHFQLDQLLHDPGLFMLNHKKSQNKVLNVVQTSTYPTIFTSPRVNCS